MPEREPGPATGGVTGRTTDKTPPPSARAALDPGDTAFDAVILAGGRARRMGGADKPGARIGGVSLLARVARAVHGADRVVVVGPERPERVGTMTVREDPPGAGPVPALRTGLASVCAPWVAVLAADLPFFDGGHLAALRDEARVRGTGAILCDRSGHPQWLAGVWNTARLRTALDAYGGSSLKGLLGPLGAAWLRLDDPVRPPWYDCDTEEELSRARGVLGPALPETTARRERNR